MPPEKLMVTTTKKNHGYHHISTMDFRGTNSLAANLCPMAPKAFRGSTLTDEHMLGA